MRVQGATSKVVRVCLFGIIVMGLGRNDIVGFLDPLGAGAFGSYSAQGWGHVGAF